MDGRGVRSTSGFHKRCVKSTSGNSSVGDEASSERGGCGSSNSLEKRGRVRVRECGRIKLRGHKVHNGSRWGVHHAMSHKFEEGRRMCVWPQGRSARSATRCACEWDEPALILARQALIRCAGGHGRCNVSNPPPDAPLAPLIANNVSDENGVCGHSVKRVSWMRV